MPEAKIGFTAGGMSFSGEGEQAWLAEQFEKILAASEKLHQLPPPPSGSSPSSDTESQSGGVSQTLASYLREKGADTNQNKKFLATANWLRRRGATILTTTSVTKALADNQQKRLGNAAVCLNRNVSKGYCEKKGDGFYITPEGQQSLG
jgi:hypothetical protein